MKTYITTSIILVTLLVPCAAQNKEFYMMKIYKKTETEILYWETWEKDDKTGIVHWGIVGDRGKYKVVHSTTLTNHRDDIQREMNEKISDGYEEIDISEHIILLIEYKIAGMGNKSDLEKRSLLSNC